MNTKQVNSKNQIWFEQTEQGVTRIGFTRSFLDGLDQCWHILPANRERFKEKSPLMVIETNDALISILSPIAGNFGVWSAKAQNFPDQLTENDVVFELRQGRAVHVEQTEPVPVAAPGLSWMDGEVGAAGRVFNNTTASIQPPMAPRPAIRRNGGTF